MRKAASLELDTESESQSELESESQSDACHPRNFVRPNWQLLLVLFSLFLPPSDPLWRQGRGAVFFFLLFFFHCAIGFWLKSKNSRRTRQANNVQQIAVECAMPPPPSFWPASFVYCLYSAAVFCHVALMSSRLTNYNAYDMQQTQGRRKRINI